MTPNPSYPDYGIGNGTGVRETGVGETSWMTGVSGITEGTGGGTMEVVATVPGELLDAMSKTGMELERVVAHLARQEEELKALKEAQKESARNMNRIGERMRDNMNSGFRAVEGGIRGKTAEDLKAMETRLKADIRSVIHSQMGDDAKRLELSLNDRVGASMERAVSSELGKALKNKATVVAVGKVVADAVASDVASACKSEFSMTIIPTFKHSTTNLFTQLNQVFQKGIKDYIDQLEKQASGVLSSTEEGRRGLETRLSEMSRESREMSTLHLQQMSSSLQNQLEMSLEGMAKKLLEEVGGMVKNVVAEELRARGGAGAPAQSAAATAKKRELQLLVQKGEMDEAFQTALNATDLDLLCFLLSKLEPKALFARQPLPLSQPVLLSLLHQLAAADLRKETELKLKYIDEALAALDETSNEVKKFLPKIVNDLNDRIKQFKDSRPNIPPPLTRLLRKIEVTCQSF